MKDKNNILNQFKKTSKPDVPQGFFDSFSEKLMDKIQNESSFLHDLPKSNQPEVPEGFFDNFEVKIDEVKAKETKVFKLKIWHAVVVAASVLIGVFIINNNQTQTNSNLVNNQTETTTTEINDDLIAYIDEGTLVDFIVSNNIQVNENETEVSDALFDELSYSIDEYYYD